MLHPDQERAAAALSLAAEKEGARELAEPYPAHVPIRQPTNAELAARLDALLARTNPLVDLDRAEALLARYERFEERRHEHNDKVLADLEAAGHRARVPRAGEPMPQITGGQIAARAAVTVAVFVVVVVVVRRLLAAGDE